MSGAVPTQTAADVASDYATLNFIIQSLLSRQATAMLVAVRTCTNNGSVSAWGSVAVVPLVNQVNGDGTSTPHGTLYKLPYFRNQGGSNGIIIDPKPGDIGLAVFAMRDISSVKSDPVSAVQNANGTAGTPPGSAREYDFADGLYFGGFLNAAPVQRIRFSDDGIEIHSPVKVTITAPQIDQIADTVINLQAPTINLKGAVHQTAGAVTIDDNVTVTGHVGVTGNVDITGTASTTGNVAVGGGLAVAGTTTGTGSATFAGNVTGAGVPLKGHNHGPGTYNVSGTPVTGNSSNT